MKSRFRQTVEIVAYLDGDDCHFVFVLSSRVYCLFHFLCVFVFSIMYGMHILILSFSLWAVIGAR